MQSFKKYFKIRHFKKIVTQQPIGGKIIIKALKSINFNIKQLETTVKVIKRIIRKKNFIIIRTLPFYYLTRKPQDVRMGRGKGNIAFKIYPVKAGSIIMEFKKTHFNLFRAIKKAQTRLPFPIKVIKIDDYSNNIKNN